VTNLKQRKRGEIKKESPPVGSCEDGRESDGKGQVGGRRKMDEVFSASQGKSDHSIRELRLKLWRK